MTDRADATSSALSEISALLRDSSGTDFSLYKANTLLRRIERRMAVRQRASIGDYAALLRQEPQELGLLFKELLIGVTRFFRDAEVWSALRDAALPDLMAACPEGKALRAWVPACSTGEEAYSLAIAFAEAARHLQPAGRFTLQIFATDLDGAAIEAARKGSYPATITADVAPDLLDRYFTEHEGGFRIAQSVRESVVFAIQDIAADAPFSKLDLLSCRNVLIYFESALQDKLLPLFHYVLNPGGLLVLGSAESIGGFDHLFTPLNLQARIFRRERIAPTMTELAWHRRTEAARASPASRLLADAGANIGQLADQLLRQTWAPPAVLVNAEGDIVYTSGRTGHYLEPAAGKTNLNVHAMARQGLREALTGTIRRALGDPRPVVLPGLRIGSDGSSRLADVTLRAIEQPEALRGHVLIAFEEAASAPVLGGPGPSGPAESPQHDALARELRETREALRMAQEGMQATVEELKSSNEELQAIVEEQQSTNEELTTAKEELQSLNAEHQTRHAELRSRLDDLGWERNDLANLLDSIEVAALFVDRRTTLRRFSAHATRLFRLIEGDIGRPLADIVTDLDHPALVADVAAVLRTLASTEAVLATRDGRRYRARMKPYRTESDSIAGVLLTFVDMGALEAPGDALRKPEA